MCKTDIMQKNKEHIDMMIQENLMGKKLGEDLAILKVNRKFEFPL